MKKNASKSAKTIAKNQAITSLTEELFGLSKMLMFVIEHPELWDNYSEYIPKTAKLLIDRKITPANFLPYWNYKTEDGIILKVSTVYKLDENGDRVTDKDGNDVKERVFLKKQKWSVKDIINTLDRMERYLNGKELTSQIGTEGGLYEHRIKETAKKA